MPLTRVDTLPQAGRFLLLSDRCLLSVDRLLLVVVAVFSELGTLARQVVVIHVVFRRCLA